MREISRRDLEDERKRLRDKLHLSDKSWLAMDEWLKMCETEEEREELSYFMRINEEKKVGIVKAEEKIQALLDLDVERIIIKED